MAQTKEGLEALFEEHLMNMTDFKRKFDAVTKEREYLIAAQTESAREISVIDQKWKAEEIAHNLAIENLVAKRKKREEEYKEKKASLVETGRNNEIRVVNIVKKQELMARKLKSMTAFLSNDTESQISPESDSDPFEEDDSMDTSLFEKPNGSVLAESPRTSSLPVENQVVDSSGSGFAASSPGTSSSLVLAQPRPSSPVLASPRPSSPVLARPRLVCRD